MRLSATAVVVAIFAAQPALSVPLFQGNIGFSSAPAPPAAVHLNDNAIARLREVFKNAQVNSDMISVREDSAGFARELEELLARADDDDSEAFSISGLKKIFKIGGIALDGANIIGSLFPGSSQQAPPPQPSQSAAAQRRGIVGPIGPVIPQIGPFSHQIGPVIPPIGPFHFPKPLKLGPGIAINPTPVSVQPTPTPTPQVVGSLPIETRELEERSVLFPGGINRLHLGPGGVIINKPFPPFAPIDHGPVQSLPIITKKPTSPQVGSLPIAQRELVELIARQLVDDESGASIGTTIGKVFDKVKDVFGDAKKLDKIATGTSIASDAASIFGSIFHGNNQSPPPPPPTQSGAPAQAPPQAREFMDLFARAVVDVARGLDELD